MADYDPTTLARVGEMVKVFDADADVEDMSYEDQFRAVQEEITKALQTGGEAVDAPSPENEQVVRQVLGQLDPTPGDAELGYGEVLRRLLSVVDTELSRWTSGLVQAPGPSGDAVVAVGESL